MAVSYHVSHSVKKKKKKFLDQGECFGNSTLFCWAICGKILFTSTVLILYVPAGAFFSKKTLLEKDILRKVTFLTKHKLFLIKKVHWSETRFF